MDRRRDHRTHHETTLGQILDVVGIFASYILVGIPHDGFVRAIVHLFVDGEPVGSDELR